MSVVPWQWPWPPPATELLGGLSRPSPSPYSENLLSALVAAGEVGAGVGVALAHRAGVRGWCGQQASGGRSAVLAGDGRQVAGAVCRRPAGGLGRRAAAGSAALDHGGAGGGGGGRHVGGDPQERHALVAG